jgi:membrane-bound lytic murein transglycosylase D
MKTVFNLSIYVVLIFVSLTGFAAGPENEQLEKIDQMISEDTPVELPDMHTEKELPKGEPWVKPDYTNQANALGYFDGVFSVPKEMDDRFNFWLQIYTRYTSEQGLLHDSKYINLIYRELDFNHINSDPNLNAFQKSRQKSKMVKDAKAEIKNILERLDKVSRQGNVDVATLTPEEQEVWKKYEKINDPDKFKNAAKKDRARFQLGQKDRIQLGILYSGRYLKKMEKIFREENLPVEITRLPFVESSFNIFARSKVGASGIWQFMPRTGRQYMKINRFIDERNDPLVATKASIRLMKLNYKILQTWPLAITAYNQGAGGLLRMSNRLKTKDLPEIIEKGNASRFGFAGENFYICFLTMLHVEANADKYFGPIQRAPELAFESLTAPSPINWMSIVSWFNNDEDMAKLYNPHINYRGRAKTLILPKGIELRVPSDKKDLAVKSMNGVSQKQQREVAKKIDKIEKPEKIAKSDKPEMPVTDGIPAPTAAQIAAGTPPPPVPDAPAATADGSYVVQRGDTLYDIARNLGVPLKTLMEANDISSPSKIRPGLKLIVPQ